MVHSWKHATFAVLIAVLGNGCAVGPDFQSPQLPFTLSGFAANQDPDAEPTIDEFSGHADHWWANLNDPLLAELIVSACDQNPGLQEALARVSQARSQREVTIGGLWPQASTEVGYARRRIAPGSSGQEGRRSGDAFDSFRNSFRASWEIDLFGRLQRQVEASDARAHGAMEDYRGVVVSLMADIATNYVELRVLQHRLSIARENLKVQSANMQMADTRQKAGLVGLLDVKQAETVVSTTESLIPSLEQEIRLRLNRLATLAGRPPSQDFYARIGAGPVPSPAVGIGTGIPAQLVQQRPDIRRAERDLHAATADIGAAVGDLYPQISLVGSPSFDTSLFSNWYRSQSFGYSVGPTVRWNIFQMGRLLNTVAAQEAARDQAEFRFRNRVLNAIEEVESGLITYRKANERAAALQRAAAAAAEAVGLSESTYQIGNTSFQRVVDAQRQLLQTQDQLASARGDVVLAWIRTYRALGGGWRSDPRLGDAASVSIPTTNHWAPSSATVSGSHVVGDVPQDTDGNSSFGQTTTSPPQSILSNETRLRDDPAPIAGRPPAPPNPDNGTALPILEELHQAPAPWSSEIPPDPLQSVGKPIPLPVSPKLWKTDH
ncbi:MAG: efflux transporter outer membrane subunit [Planctomycetaceae bacterium]